MWTFRRASPSGMPSEFANPWLVVASASKPSPARTRAVPASHGFGITKMPGPSCRAWNAAALSWMLMRERYSDRDEPSGGRLPGGGHARARPQLERVLGGGGDLRGEGLGPGQPDSHAVPHRRERHDLRAHVVSRRAREVGLSSGLE